MQYAAFGLGKLAKVSVYPSAGTKYRDFFVPDDEYARLPIRKSTKSKGKHMNTL